MTSSAVKPESSGWPDHQNHTVKYVTTMRTSSGIHAPTPVTEHLIIIMAYPMISYAKTYCKASLSWRCRCIITHSLVMNSCSCDFLKTQLILFTTYTVPAWFLDCRTSTLIMVYHRTATIWNFLISYTV